MIDPFATFWEEILSREPVRIRAAYANLAADEKRSVLAHLKKMSREPGWHPAQVESALAALRALDGHSGEPG
jgi:hypothetical protein